MSGYDAWKTTSPHVPLTSNESEVADLAKEIKDLRALVNAVYRTVAIQHSNDAAVALIEAYSGEL